MSTQRRRKLRNLFINKGFQGRVVGLVLFAGALSFLLNGLLFYLYVQKNYAIIFASSDVPPLLVETLVRDLRQFGAVLLGLSVLATIVIAFYISVMTHRAAGAAYHIHRVVKEVNDGVTGSRIHLRQRDEFKELAAAINEMIDNYESQAKDSS